MNSWINFKELREKLNFESVLRHFGVEVKRNGNQHKGPCPLPGHVGERKAPTFSAELERGIFRCFGCGRKGNVLEFAAMMRETVSGGMKEVGSWRFENPFSSVGFSSSTWT